MKVKPFFQLDFYKTGHHLHYPDGTQFVYSNFTPRSSLTDNQNVTFFGLQYFIKEYLIKQWNEEFFRKPLAELKAEYERVMHNTVGDVGWDHWEDLWNLDYLPIRIKAVKEGTTVPVGTPVLTIVNTHEHFYWFTNFIESVMSCELWKACTSATTSRVLRELCEDYALHTCDNAEHVPFQLHDFSMRGMGGLQDACVSGAGHLLNSFGTDTVPAITFLEEYYNADVENELIGTSVPATEHSVTSASCGIHENDEPFRVTEGYNEEAGKWEVIGYTNELGSPTS